MCDVQGRRYQATPDVVRQCVFSDSYDGITQSTSSVCMCSTRAMRSYHAHRCLTVCAIKGLWWHATPELVQMCVLSKDHDCMPRLNSSKCVCCQRAMITCHAWHRSIMCAFQRIWWHDIPDIVHLCVQSKSDDEMTLPRSLSSVCYQRARMLWHARARPTVCPIKGPWWHVMPDVIWFYMLCKGYAGMPYPDFVGPHVLFKSDNGIQRPT